MSILSIFKKKDVASSVKDEKPAKDKSALKEEKKDALSETKEALVFYGMGNHILVRPVITEKTSIIASAGKYAFHVASKATKTEVRNAVEKRFGVNVEKVNIIKVRAKTRMRGAITGKVSGYRKAIVALRDGQSIDLTK